MSDRLGFVSYSEDGRQPKGLADTLGGREFSEQTAQTIDEETKRIIDEAYADTRRLVQENREKLEAVAKALLKYETIDGDDVKRLMAGEILDKPTVADLINAEQDRRAQAKTPPVARPVEHRPPGGAGPMPEPA
jgi:cell division protease FtsH